MPLPSSITTLTAALAKLPGIGPRSAERIALHLVQAETGTVKQLADAILAAREKVHLCTTCGALTEVSPCDICASPRRDASLVCVVERPVDILSVDKGGTFHGKFHVLGGKISPLDGVGPEQIGSRDYEALLDSGEVREVILATNPTVEGEATAHFLGERAAQRGIQASRIAHGVPIGGELEYVDGGTLAHALAGRNSI